MLAVSQQGGTHLSPREQPPQRPKRDGRDEVPPTPQGSDAEHEGSEGACYQGCGSQKHKCLNNSVET